MTTELVLLLSLFAFLLLGPLIGDSGPGSTFSKSAPRLGARIEKELMTGMRFTPKRSRNLWQAPPGGGD